MLPFPTLANTLFCDFRWAFFVSSSSLVGLYAFKSCTVSTQGFGAAAAEVDDEAVAVFFFPDDEEDPDFLDLSGVFRERERVGRAADICKFGAVSVTVWWFASSQNVGGQYSNKSIFDKDGRLG